MQNSQVKHEAVERQAGQAQAMSEFGGQAGVVEAMAFVSGQPFDDLGDGRPAGRFVAGEGRRPMVRFPSALRAIHRQGSLLALDIRTRRSALKYGGRRRMTIPALFESGP